MGLGSKWGHSSYTGTCKHTGDQLFDTRTNWISYIWKKEQQSKPECYN